VEDPQEVRRGVVGGEKRLGKTSPQILGGRWDTEKKAEEIKKARGEKCATRSTGLGTGAANGGEG